MKVSIFDKIVGYLAEINDELKELLEECYNHRDLTIVRLKKYIDDRTRAIVLDAK